MRHQPEFVRVQGHPRRYNRYRYNWRAVRLFLLMVVLAVGGSWVIVEVCR